MVDIDDNADYTWKVILVGNKRVGKTSISNRYMKNDFNAEEKSSEKVTFRAKKIIIPTTQHVAELHIWDTLGQEKFKALSPIFFRKSVAALLVYDVTDKDSFLALRGWHEQILNNTAENIVVILIGNKVDLPNKVITNEMGANYARENGWLFMEVSAKQDINIKSAFLTLASHVYKEISGNDNEQNVYDTNTRGESISLHSKNKADLTEPNKGKKEKKDCKC